MYSGGEFIVMGVPGESLDKETADVIRQVQPAGFILFARNIKSPQQLRTLSDELRAAVKHEPIITIDQEGGRVSRLKEFMTEPPSAKNLSEQGNISLIKKHGELTGKLLRLFGFNVDLAPVLDTLVNEKNDNSLKDRTYGSTPEQVASNAAAFVEAMTAEGVLCCGKHYPVYSHANVDPHHDLPSVNRSLAELENFEWVPFRKLLPLLDLIMVGHVSYPQLDPSGLPATLSASMVRRVLREEWRYSGCTITDDMDMGAIKSKYGSAEAAVRALQAGNDLILVCHSVAAVPEIAAALRKAEAKVLDESFQRIDSLRKRLSPPLPFSMEKFKNLDAQTAELRETVLKSTRTALA